MLSHHGMYLSTIRTSISGIESISLRLKGASEQSSELRKSMAILKIISTRTKKITVLNIKSKNLKNTLKVLEDVPKLRKMSVFELKQINMSSVANLKQNHSNLLCIQHLERYVETKSTEMFGDCIAAISECLLNYNEEVYESVLKSMILVMGQNQGLEHTGVNYQKLLSQLLET